MRQRTEPLRDKSQTATRMYDLIDSYAADLHRVKVRRSGQDIPISRLPLDDFFDFVRRIPYKRDRKPVEILMRPYYAFRFARKGLDCKKKAIAVSSYLALNGIPYRLIGSSRRRDGRIHHVFPQGFISGQWRNLDATYPEYELFQNKNDVTHAEVL
jgi:hypothetical protein